MHRCLQIPEIVLHVVSELDSRRSLAQLARTCQFLSSPALDALWYEPRDSLGHSDPVVFHLLHSLPQDLLVMTTVSREVFLELKRPAVLSDWERFQSYANRVRVCSYSSRFQLKAMVSLALWLPGDVLIRSFLAPNLRSIELTGARSASLLSQLPALIQRRLPLRSFTYSCGDGDDPLRPVDLESLSLFVQTLSRITSLSLPALDLKAFEFLRTHPCLTTLDIESFPRPADLSRGVPRLASDSFQNLRSFTSLKADIPMMLLFLPLLCGPLLEQITVRPTTFVTTAQMTAFYGAISNHCQPSSLVSFHSFEYSLGEFHQIELEAFRGLSRFTKLTSILISTRGGFQFGDDSVEELYRACSALTELRFRQFREDSPFTLSSLLRLAAHCKDLSVLEMTVDMAAVPWIYPTPTPGNDSLTRHCVSSPPVTLQSRMPCPSRISSPLCSLR
ncbi:hypothetical protein C8F01DRAFT_1353876 [Mycena amicta]|nr:hypothetical protein C8F01DRAFT_1353876 [Mycena amicta]